MGNQLRLLESQIRDEIQGSDTPSIPLPPGPPHLGTAGPPLVRPWILPGPPPPVPAPAIPKEGKPLQPPPAPEPKTGGPVLKGPADIELYAKPKGAAAPETPEPKTPVKVEPARGSKDKSPTGVVDLPLEEEIRRKDKKEKKRKKKSRSRSHRRKEEKRKEKGRTRSPSQSEKDKRRKHSSEEKEAERDQEERQPAQASEPRQSAERPSSHRGRKRGPGWIGEVPYSNHPRWTHSKNRGIVKRAKQEIYNRARGRGGSGRDQWRRR